jgi:hypothetical protein
MDLQAFYAGDIVPCYRLRKLIVDRNHKYRPQDRPLKNLRFRRYFSPQVPVAVGALGVS